tara:strand:+ start:6048 stop:6641 length:594 start_codon:yes stop_codon:yes gene_type:complete
MNRDTFSIFIILFIIVISYHIYLNTDVFQLKCIISDIDGQKYCVRERSKLKLAADRLAMVNENMKSLVNYCIEKFPNNENIIRLHKGFNPKRITETLPTSQYTAYSENKGEKIAFCLDTKKHNAGKLIDLNTLTFVAIHELAHVASKSIGHTPEFWKNFKFLLIQAEKIDIYTPIDYKNNPQSYCGMEITDNPYFDS